MTAPAGQEALLDHYRHPRNRGGLAGAQVVRRGANPRCGDLVEVGVSFEGERVAAVVFEGRGCSICIASASLMTEAVAGLPPRAARQLAGRLRTWLDDGDPHAEAPSGLAALAPVRHQRARRRCMLLCWEALEAALAAVEERSL